MKKPITVNLIKKNRALTKTNDNYGIPKIFLILNLKVLKVTSHYDF